IDRTHILVLNYNGRDLLAECLPSAIEAAGRSPIECPVTVIDNDSTDGSLELLAARWPEVRVVRQPNAALASFNRVLRDLDEPVYLPGRIEDLDLGFRGWMAGYKGYYEPGSVAYHRGFGTFGPELGRATCDRLAIRNSFLFAWKNLRGTRLAAHLCWIPPRLLYWL